VQSVLVYSDQVLGLKDKTALVLAYIYSPPTPAKARREFRSVRHLEAEGFVERNQNTISYFGRKHTWENAQLVIGTQTSPRGMVSGLPRSIDTCGRDPEILQSRTG